jgi:hypothetical protein
LVVVSKANYSQVDFDRVTSVSVNVVQLDGFFRRVADATHPLALEENAQLHLFSG